MKSPIPDYLDKVLDDIRADGDGGERADHIPELADAEPDRLAAVIVTTDGEIYACGDSNEEFSIQSIAKPLAYALAVQDRGWDEVHSKVGVEPSGEAFNELSMDSEGRPYNPMINAGAITVHSMLVGPEASPEEKLDRVIKGLSAFAGRELSIDERVCGSELDHAHRNLAIAHMLSGCEALEGEATDVVEGYTRQSSLLVTTRDLGVMAATLANDGVNPVTEERVIGGDVVKQVLSVMTTCGMYDAAGDWVTQVGIPAKSGVAGGVIGALPGQLGIATFSPRLDEHGNSVRGVALFERMSADLGLHLMHVPAMDRSVIRDVTVIDASGGASGSSGEVRVVEVQGSIRFSGAERLVRQVYEGVNDGEFTEKGIALDLTAVHAIDIAAQTLILEILERLCADGKDVYLIDPDDVIPEAEARGDGTLTVIETREEL